jgi:hypothetical protein
VKSPPYFDIAACTSAMIRKRGWILKETRDDDDDDFGRGIAHEVAARFLSRRSSFSGICGAQSA